MADATASQSEPLNACFGRPIAKADYRGQIPLFDEEELDKSDRAFALVARPKPARPKPENGGDGGAVAA